MCEWENVVSERECMRDKSVCEREEHSVCVWENVVSERECMRDTSTSVREE